MANVKHGNLTPPRQWWKHMDFFKRVFWKRERQAHQSAAEAQASEAMHSRTIDRSARLDEFGDTVWPDSTWPNPPLKG
jgi:hypothetical protein